MTTNEQKIINQLHGLVSDIRTENQTFKDSVMQLINNATDKVEKKHLPIYLEKDILQVVQQSINDSIKAVLTGYSSPLNKLITEVVNENSVELKSLISDSFTKVIRTDEFKQSIVSAFSHKVARSIISNNDGLFDKVSNELKQDAIFKSKMSLAVSNVVEECLTQKS